MPVRSPDIGTTKQPPPPTCCSSRGLPFARMGLFGKRGPNVARTAQPTALLNVDGRTRRLLVHSESFPKTYKGAREGAAVQVELVPEPTNAHDRNAVLGYVNGEPAGWLGAGPAAAYQPVIARANVMGYRVLAPGVFEDVGGMSVRVSLPKPEQLAAWLDRPLEQRGDGFPT